MINRQQFMRLQKMKSLGESTERIALKCDMSIKTARKYLKAAVDPFEKRLREYRTREDPLSEVWPKAESILGNAPTIEAKTVFEHLKEEHPDLLGEASLRTFQRKVKDWRIENGHGKTVYFEQIHHPGRLSESDFTSMTSLGITINGEKFSHMLYHFVLTYSNWEYAEICKSETFESLSSGFQNAVFNLGGLPKLHQTDQLSAAVTQFKEREAFTKSYHDLMNYYKVEPRKIQVAKPNENGDIEKSHDVLKRAIEQALLLRCSKDFTSEKDYDEFIQNIIRKRNSLKREKVLEERNHLNPLPLHKTLESRQYKVRVSKFSIIHVASNNYSINSRYIGATLTCVVKANEIGVFYNNKKVTTLPRLRGKGNCCVRYQDIIGGILRKPGSFENYKYKASLYPSTNFRMAYDILVQEDPLNGTKKYLKILEHAVYYEEKVNSALALLISNGEQISLDKIMSLVDSEKISHYDPKNIMVCAPDLSRYDTLLETV